MAVSTNLIVAGTVARITTRQVTSKTTGEVIVFTTALVVGDKCIAAVRVPDTIKGIAVGVSFVGVVTVSTYRDDDQLELVELLDNQHDLLG